MIEANFNELEIKIRTSLYRGKIIRYKFAFFLTSFYLL